MISQHH
jgi:hypothetical protein